MGSRLMELTPATSEQFEPYLGEQWSERDRSRLMRARDTVKTNGTRYVLAR
jgi:hypothetical protein